MYLVKKIGWKEATLANDIMTYWKKKKVTVCWTWRQLLMTLSDITLKNIFKFWLWGADRWVWVRWVAQNAKQTADPELLQGWRFRGGWLSIHPQDCMLCVKAGPAVRRCSYHTSAALPGLFQALFICANRVNSNRRATAYMTITPSANNNMLKYKVCNHANLLKFQL